MRTAPDTQARTESQVRAAIHAGDHRGAVEITIRAYGDNALRFLQSMARSSAEADEAFSRFCLALMQGIGSWRGDAKLETWVLVVARNTYYKLVRAERGRGHTGISRASKIVAPVRHSTQRYLKTDVKDAMRELREELSELDRGILTLRIDQARPWEEVAAILLPDSNPTRATQRLRKRFERAKTRLRKLAEERGIL